MNINRIKADTFVLLISKGKPNSRAKVVEVTPKRVYIWKMENGSYIKDADGEPRRFLVDPKNLVNYTEADRKVKKEKV